ncbi:hypothetical protein FF011L_01530 [Roseimaritima multifibrata]|uniref:DUF4369 domain-containing protein n=1 Tax=Roseimaritima multifibrata TaxID=1930274 RepID=A0A517M957_9BACT|nr:hypothetical protein [Roseimaritima multifibrata]QDS91423.1 hypothetical protein FF011L_01530 [Roseimaritima multifibrata]
MNKSRIAILVLGFAFLGSNIAVAQNRLSGKLVRVLSDTNAKPTYTELVELTLSQGMSSEIGELVDNGRFSFSLSDAKPGDIVTFDLVSDDVAILYPRYGEFTIPVEQERRENIKIELVEIGSDLLVREKNIETELRWLWQRLEKLEDDNQRQEEANKLVARLIKLTDRPEIVIRFKFELWVVLNKDNKRLADLVELALEYFVPQDSKAVASGPFPEGSKWHGTITYTPLNLFLNVKPRTALPQESEDILIAVTSSSETSFSGILNSKSFKDVKISGKIQKHRRSRTDYSIVIMLYTFPVKKFEGPLDSAAVGGEQEMPRLGFPTNTDSIGFERTP